MTRVKICGIRSYEEACMAANAGAWAIGEVFAPSSRRIEVPEAAAINQRLGNSVCRVGVFVNEDPELVNCTVAACNLDLVQLHGSESPDYVRKIDCPVIKAFAITDGAALPIVHNWPVIAFLFDTYDPQQAGGTGRVFNWEQVKGFPAPFVIAGGLNPANVNQVIKELSPWAVDVSSGVEVCGQGKRIEKINNFISQVKAADDKEVSL